MQQDFCRLRRKSKLIRDLLVVEPLELVEEDRQPLAVGELEDGRPDPLGDLPVLEGRARGAAPGLAGSFRLPSSSSPPASSETPLRRRSWDRHTFVAIRSR